MKQFYTYQEAAKELGVSVSTLTKAASGGSLRVQVDPTQRTRKYITKVALEQYRKKMRKRVTS